MTVEDAERTMRHIFKLIIHEPEEALIPWEHEIAVCQKELIVWKGIRWYCTFQYLCITAEQQYAKIRQVRS